MKTNREAKIVRQDLDGSKIVVQPGGTLYQVYFRGKYISAFASPATADAMLNSVQARTAQ